MSGFLGHTRVDWASFMDAPLPYVSLISTCDTNHGVFRVGWYEARVT